MATLTLPDKLHEYPQQDVLDGASAGADSILDDCLNENDGVLQLLHRYAGRTFCTPGKRIRLDAKSYYPDYMGGTGLDEIWMCCTVPIVTGVIDTRTGKAPFREGEAHVLTPNGQVISLQDLIAANPKAVMGEKIMAVAESLFGEITWPIVSNKFDNLNPIPHHLHWSKWQVYDINSFDNPGVNPSHYHTTAMGLYPFVTKDDFLACMKRWGQGEYNGVRHLSPHTMMHIDNGFVMPNGVLHSPTDLCTHELHVTMDEHFLAEDLTLDGRIGAADAFYACREEDYPKNKHEDWEYLVEKFDFAANQDPVLKRVFTTYTANTPQIFLNIDRTRAEYMGVPVGRIFSTLRAQLGSAYVNDFNLNGRTYQVKVQAEAPFRDSTADIERLYVRSKDGNMVPLKTLLTMEQVLGPQVVSRYNQYPSAQFNGSAAPGFHPARPWQPWSNWHPRPCRLASVMTGHLCLFRNAKQAAKWRGYSPSH